MRYAKVDITKITRDARGCFYHANDMHLLKSLGLSDYSSVK
jgi:hypothetical protein